METVVRRMVLFYNLHVLREPFKVSLNLCESSGKMEAIV